MKNVFAVANRLGTVGQDPGSDLQAKLEQIQTALGEVPLIGALPNDPGLSEGVLRIGSDGAIEPTEALIAHTGAIESIIAEVRSRV